ncbi:MgtC/SapB family protein [Vulcaniibacterium gelatinicum]|uniref:MgtC/SapB family protein n=1 Tax=Vulcaniibacterium gelatinicum TaxID=2598725 RepID=UPI001C70083F|nr:DUF4010 domain-containing protein [Vulcaniibacterium gelatinicum]
MSAWQGLAVALGIGLLVGVERERSKGDGERRATAGIRTFALVALAGAVAQMLGGIALAVVGAFVALAALASWRWTRTRDPGLTTEAAMVVVFLLGVLAMREIVLAAALGVVVTVLLAAKTRMHRFVRHVLSEQELHDGLLLAAGAAVVLPLLPDRTVDPWQVLNPRQLWILALLVMGINAAGHVALRMFGTRTGLLVTGVAGGFVSSTATIASLGMRARRNPAIRLASASAGVLSNLSTVIQLAIILGAFAPALLLRLAWPLAAAGVAVLVFALVSGWRSRGETMPEAASLVGRAFEPKHALLFVAVVATVMTISAAAHARWGHAALEWTMAFSGLADVHAAAATAAQLVAVGRVGADEVGVAVLLAFATNSLMKVVLAFVTGGRGYGLRLLPGVAAMVAAFTAGLAFG